MVIPILFLTLLFIATSTCQVLKPPIFEHFDGLTPPALPSGWSSTTHRLPGGDFATTPSGVFSIPNAVITTNATIEQELTSPLLDFEGIIGDSLIFQERRSSTHKSGLLIEASTDGGLSYSVRIGDTLRQNGSGSYSRRAFPLPPALNNMVRVRVRWRMLGDGSGTTGTCRLDDIRLTALYPIDVCITGVRAIPEQPEPGETTQISVIVENCGPTSTGIGTLDLYLDADADGIGEPDEFIKSELLPSFVSRGDSAEVVVRVVPQSHGMLHFIIQASIQGDMNAGNNTVHFILRVGASVSSVVINELMYSPKHNEPEWVEIFAPGPESADLAGWTISDENTEKRYSLGSGSVLLRAGEFLVLTKSAAMFRLFHPDTGPVLEIPSMPASLWNNSGDVAVLSNASGEMIDSVAFGPWLGGGDSTSLERIVSGGSSTDPRNWTSSSDPSGSTPGKENDASPREVDIRIERLTTVECRDSICTVSILLRNTGLSAADSVVLRLFHDGDRDSSVDVQEQRASRILHDPLPSGDSVIASLVWYSPPAGEQNIIVSAELASDGRPRDNMGWWRVHVAYRRSCVMISEIMFDPGQKGCEYVEVVNTSESAVRMTGWRLHTSRDTSAPVGRIFIKEDISVDPGGFIALAADSSIYQRFSLGAGTRGNIAILGTTLSLGNDGDYVMIIDPAGAVIDSLAYSPSWHTPDIEHTEGRSLERIRIDVPSTDPRNWATSAGPDGGTPGARNSVAMPVQLPEGSLSATPNPFSPDGDGFEDAASISYSLPFSPSIIRVRIFDASGRIVRHLAEAEPAGVAGTLIWNGYDDRGERVHIGIFIILLEVRGGERGDSEIRLKGTVVVGRPM